VIFGKNSRWVRLHIMLCLAACSAVPLAHAGQVLNTNSTTSCTAQGGTLVGGNVITDFDNGTFGTEDGSPNQSPAADMNPYPGQVIGGIFDNFYEIDHGDYAYIANAVTPRNPFQHPDITDPVNGITGRFFASDPNVDTPTLNFTIFDVTPNQNYEVSFWAANSEPNGTPNIVNAVLNDITSYSTGPLPAFQAALEWRRHGFIFNAGNRTSVSVSMASTETGAGGRDFYLDNVEMQRCVLTMSGSITGTVYADSNSNNAYNSGDDGILPNITVQLWDTQGDADADNDIFVSETSSSGGSGGLYTFENLPPLTTYSVRILTTDPDLPAGASAGTPETLPVTVTSGNTTTDVDFGFDISTALLEAAKSVELASGSQYAIPGEDVIYTITAFNRGDGITDNNSLFLVDTLPPNITFFNDDLDGVGGLTSDPVAFTQSAANLNFDYARDVGFAQAGTKPTNFGQCNYTPVGTYDPTVAFICFAPNGQMAAGAPDPSFAFSFRAGIN